MSAVAVVSRPSSAVMRFAVLLGVVTLVTGCGGSKAAAFKPRYPAVGIAAGSLEFWKTRDVDRELNDYQRLHATWIRHDFPWNVIEPGPGQFRWAGFDRWVAAARKRGINVIATLGYTPPWANGGHADRRYGPTSAQRFARYAGIVAGRYSKMGVHVYEIWNEPNATYWRPSPDPDAYTKMLCAAYGAIHRADPRAVVLTGGMSPAANLARSASAPATYSPQTWLADIYAAGGGHCFDGVGYHPYVDSVPTHGALGGNWYLMYTGNYATTIRGVMRANHDGEKRIWATEVGCNRAILGDAECSYRIGEALAAWKTYKWAAVLCWFTYSDNTSYGLVNRSADDRTWSRSPEWHAYRAAAANY